VHLNMYKVCQCHSNFAGCTVGCAPVSVKLFCNPKERVLMFFLRRALPKQQNNREEINAELVKDTWHIRKAIAKDIPLQDIPQGAGSGWRYRRPHTLAKSRTNAVLERDEEQERGELEKIIDTVAGQGPKFDLEHLQQSMKQQALEDQFATSPSEDSEREDIEAMRRLDETLFIARAAKKIKNYKDKKNQE
jgi:hypothetical protein